jgi:hypothetical protein
MDRPYGIHWRSYPAFVLVFLLAGCAATYTQPQLPDDHPASPTATATSMPEHPNTLELSRADPVPGQSGVATPSGDASSHKHEPPPVGAINQEDSPAGAAKYACPMHPEVTSDKPDQRCPKCGMKLKPEDKSGATR